jgi:hypothetical protein
MQACQLEHVRRQVLHPSVVICGAEYEWGLGRHCLHSRATPMHTP